MRIWFTAFVILLFTFSIPAAAERGVSIAGKRSHVALIIGNSDYEAITRLQNPRNDAEAIGDALADLGFSVEVLLDGDLNAMLDALREFRNRSRGAEQAVIYYAGHGLELDGQNYMLPVDAELESDLDVAFEALPLDLFSRSAEGASELSLVILDACRNNPFELQIADATRSLSRGLAEVEPPSNTLIAFAARAGTVAKDGAAGGNSPFAEALLETLAEPRVEIGFFFRKVRDGVHARTGGQQTPFVYGSLPAQEIFLNQSAADAVNAMPPLTVVPAPDRAQPQRPPTIQSPSIDEGAFDLTFWTSIKDSERREDFEAYLERFPDGTFAALALNRLKMDDLEIADNGLQNRTSEGSLRKENQCLKANGDWSVQNVTENDTLFVRTGPNFEAPAVGEIPFNTEGITLGECVPGGYCEMRYGCIKGFVHGNYLGPSIHIEEQSRFEGMYEVKGRPAGTLFNLRTGPGTEYQSVGVIPHDAKGLLVSDCHPNAADGSLWCALSWLGLTGWAFGGFLEKQ